MYEKILIANDGSEGAGAALTTAIALAKRLQSSLHMICVEEMPQFLASVDEIVEEKREENHRFGPVVSRACAQAKGQRVNLETHVVAGHAVPRIVEFLESRNFDLLVIGFMGHSALYNRLIGSTTDRLVELAPCQVLFVK
jgi:nucleotide-binding universal stress UspA family protein